MSDIATLGLAVDATQVTKAAGELDKLTAASERTQASANKVGAEVQRQTQAMQQVIPATQQASTAIDRNSKAYQDLDREIEKIIVSSSKALSAQAQLGRAQATLAEGLEKGVLSQAGYNSALAAVTTKFGPAAEGVKKLEDATTKLGGSGKALSGGLTRDIRELATELIEGRLQYAASNVLQIGTRLGALTPAIIGVGAALAGTVGIFALLAVKAELAARALKEVESGFAATGNATPISDKLIKSYIDSLSLLPGVSRDAATKSIAELARVPYITGPLFAQSTKILGDFAAMLGTDVPKASAVLAKALDDPFQASEALDKQFNLLTANQRLTIDGFAQTGDKAGALSVLLQALEDRSKGLSDQGLTPLQKAVNDLSREWDGLSKSLFDTSGPSAASNAITSLLNATGGFVKYLREHSGEVSDFFNKAAHYVVGLPGNVATVGGSSANASVSPSFGDLQRSDRAADTAASRQAAVAQDQQTRALLDRTNYLAKVDQNKQLRADESALKKLLDDGNLSLMARGQIQERIAGIQERIKNNTPKGRAAVEPLGLNVDEASLQAQLKVYDLQQKAEKAALDEQQRYRDFYHKAGIISTDKFNAETQAANDQYLAEQQTIFAKEIAAVEAHQAELNKIVPSSKGQSDQLQAAMIKDEQKLVELKGQEATLTAKIKADSDFRAVTAPIIKQQEDFNRALKSTQEIQSSLSEAETRANLDVQLGLKTQFEGIRAVTAARQEAMVKLQEQLAIEQKIHDESQLDPASDEYIRQAKAIDDINIKLLQMQANLDPIGQKINGFVSSGLTDFLDKLGTGVHTFKDLREAAKAYFDDLAKNILHLANQETSDQIAKFIGVKVDGSSGGTGGIGGFISRAFSTGSGVVSGSSSNAASAGSDDAMGDFIKNLDAAGGGLKTFAGNSGLGGAVRSSAAYVEKLIFGTTAETAASSATTTTTGAMVTLTTAANAAAAALSRIAVSGGGSSGSGLGGLGGLFGSSSALASTTSTAGNSINVGITDEALALFHDGGIVGQSSATRNVRFSSSDVANAPRFHAGGVVGLNGYNERLAVMKDGEEVLTENDPRHRKNGGRSAGKTIVQNNNFIMPRGSTLNPLSQSQLAGRAGAAAQRALTANT